VCAGHDLDRTDPELVVTIPGDFAGMLNAQPDLARAWRMASREIFTAYLAKGYRVVDFSFAPGADHGTYLLEAGAAKS